MNSGVNRKIISDTRVGGHKCGNESLFGLMEPAAINGNGDFTSNCNTVVARLVLYGRPLPDPGHKTVSVVSISECAPNIRQAIGETLGWRSQSLWG